MLLKCLSEMVHRRFILVTILVSARAAGLQGYTKQFKWSLTWNKTALWNYPQRAPGFSLKPQPEHYQLLLFHKVKTVSSKQCVMAQLNICTGKLFHQISWQPCMDFTPQMDHHTFWIWWKQHKKVRTKSKKRNISQLIRHAVVILLFGNNSVTLFHIKREAASPQFQNNVPKCKIVKTYLIF